MTLIAGYKVDDVPVLLGDFLISSGDLVGTRKKIHVISPNFVVGWTGDLWAARPVLKSLYDDFHDVHVHHRALEKLLTEYPTQELGSLSVQIAGWVIDGEARCFFWRSDWPKEVFYHSEYFLGSGAETFKRMLSRRSYLASARERKGVEAAIYLSLINSCRLITDEILFGLNRQQGFGFAFETAYFDGNQFKFVNETLFSAADIFYDPTSGQIHHRFYPVTLKYRSFDSFSVIQETQLAEPQITRLFAITPIFDDMPNLLNNLPGNDPSKNEVLPLVSDYYCLFWRLQARDRVIANGVAVDPSENSSHYIQVTKMDNGEQKLEIDFDFIRKMYPTILNSGWGTSIASKQSIPSAGQGLQFKIGQCDVDAAVGLRNNPKGAFTEFAYALWCRADGYVQIYESGVPFGDPRTYKADDVFSIDLISADGLQLVMFTQNRQPIALRQCRAEFPLVACTMAKEGRCLVKEANIRTLATTETLPEMSLDSEGPLGSK